jgi:hypothetical protein
MNEDKRRTNRLIVGLVVGAIFGLGIGLVLGLLYAYQIAPVQFTDAEPQNLRADYASYYWQSVAEVYAQNGDLERARQRLGPWENTDYLQTVQARVRQEAHPDVVMASESVATQLFGPDAAPPPSEAEGPPTTTGPLQGINWGTFLGVFLLVILILVVIGLLISRRGKTDEESTERVTEVEDAEWAATARTQDAETVAAAVPDLGHFVTSYSFGNDHYDESFSIETPTGEFLGECGVGISETIGEGSPDQVTAFEVWLFDKNDIRTVTKVLMSEYAYNDIELRDRLAPKGDAVLAQANVPLVLETATLRVEATATEVIYGESELPPNSFFERLTVEMLALEPQAEPDIETVYVADPEPDDEVETEVDDDTDEDMTDLDI